MSEIHGYSKIHSDTVKLAVKNYKMIIDILNREIEHKVALAESDYKPRWYQCKTLFDQYRACRTFKTFHAWLHTRGLISFEEHIFVEIATRMDNYKEMGTLSSWLMEDWYKICKDLVTYVDPNEPYVFLSSRCVNFVDQLHNIFEDEAFKEFVDKYGDKNDPS